MKIAAAVLVMTMFLAASCSREVVSPGNDIRGSLPMKTHTLEELWEQAGSSLPAAGRPTPLDVYTEAHDISGEGIMVIDVRSHDFDPIAVVVDGAGELLAYSDNWKGTSSARIVIDGAPSGGRLLVFSHDDSRGLYDVVVRRGSQDDLDAFAATMGLENGSVTGWMAGDVRNPEMDDFLRDILEDNVYNYNYEKAQLFPFNLDDEELVSLSLESDDFDPYLVLLSAEDGDYSFVDYNDDYSGSWSRIVRQLGPGRFMAVVMPYSAEGYGEFRLAMELMDERALEATGTEASEAGIEYTGEIVPERNFAMAWWPGMMEDWEVPSFLDPFYPVAAFTFSVPEPALYQASAYGDIDVCLTILRTGEDGVTCVASNDDYVDLGTDSRVVTLLMPGDYAALVSSYSGADQGEVTFSWMEQEGAGMSLLTRGRTVTEYAPYETESLIYRLEVRSGQSYTISVESQELDPVIDLYLPDGTVLYDDDGGDGTNSLLSFTADAGGTCFLTVEKYSPGEGTFSIEFR